MHPILLILSILGLISFTRLTFSFLYSSYAFFLRPAKDLKACYGPWAIVTGPTDGIGKAIAFELARKNLNLILVGRNPEKLEDVSTSIKDKYGNTEIKNVVMDLAGDTSAGLNKLREAVEGADVGVLVNNAGTVNKYAMWFHEGEAEKWMEIVKVNLESLTEVTRVVLHGMVERKRGAIVNIGSGSTVAVPSMPLLAVYAATKAGQKSDPHMMMMFVQATKNLRHSEVITEAAPRSEDTSTKVAPMLSAMLESTLF